MRLRAVTAVLLLALVLPTVVPLSALAAPANTDDQAQTQSTDEKKKEKKEGNCAGGVPLFEQGCDAAEGLAGLPDRVTGALGEAAEDVAESAADQMTQWMIDAAIWTTKQIVKGIQETTTPELEAKWYEERFESMMYLAFGLSMLVALISLLSAALRRDPDALGATVVGMLRAGIGTGLVIALTVVALGVADAMTNVLASGTVGKDASAFWTEVGEAWGKDNFAGLGSSAIAFLLAFVQVMAALLVWLELLVRSAAIYVAVLFMPMALAAGIWPAMRDWQNRLAKTLLVFILLKPVVVTVLSLAGYAAKAGITGEAEKDIGVLLSAVVIFALAALSPWALMAMINASAEGTRAARVGAGAARESTGKVGGALSSPAGGGLRAFSQRGSGGGSGGGPGGGSGVPSSRPRGGGPGGNGGKPISGTGGGVGGKPKGLPLGSNPGNLNAVGAVAAAAGLTMQSAQRTAQAPGDRAERASQGGGEGGPPRSSGGAPGDPRFATASQRGSAQQAPAGGEPQRPPGGLPRSDASSARSASQPSKHARPPAPKQSDPRPAPRPAAPSPQPRLR